MSLGTGGGGGRVIAGRYELSTLIGQGGMGQVWTAYDQRLDRRVAVKLLRPDRVAGAEAEELRRRFVRECRVTAQVDHPGLVTVHDAGTEDEDLYLVMQYVDGADLGDHLAEHDPYPWQWAVAIAAQLCAVLSAVHAVPIVHRDLKPRNVMVKQDGTVSILDLGIASVMDTDTTRLTHTGSPIGSPAYMAPEQAMGGAVGPYTDLYALGVLLHELLSGDVPFSGSTALGVLHRHLYEPPLPVRRLRAEVPEALEALVLRLLAKDPHHRHASAQEVYEELAPLLPARGIPTGGPLDPTRPFLRPHAPWPDRAATPAAAPDIKTERPDQRQIPGGPGSQTDVVRAVDEVKRLLGEGRITQAVDILGSILPAAAAKHGEHSPVVRSLRKQYAATLMDDGQYRRALPELRRLALAPVPLRGRPVPGAARRTGGGTGGVPRPPAVLREPLRLRRPRTPPGNPPPHRPLAAGPRRPGGGARHPGAAPHGRRADAWGGASVPGGDPAYVAVAGTSARLANGEGAPTPRESLVE